MILRHLVIGNHKQKRCYLYEKKNSKGILYDQEHNFKGKTMHTLYATCYGS
jgi:hypothetical protein